MNPAELPTRAKHTLVIWNTKADGRGTPFIFGTTKVTSDITIYAQWIGIPTLTATSISASQINLSWERTTNATKYNLFDGSTQIGGDITETKYSHTGLEGGSTHTYTLKACNEAGCSDASNAVTATTNEATVTVTEIPKTIPSKYTVLDFSATQAKRFHYVAFSISADAQLTDYVLTLKKKNTPAAPPSTNDMQTKTVIKRNIGKTPIHILLHYDINSTIATDFNAASTTVKTGTTVDTALLSPNTMYTLYGMKKGGTTVVALGDFSTDAFDATATYNGGLQQTLDPILYTYQIGTKTGTTSETIISSRTKEVASDYSISLRDGEPRIIPFIMSATFPTSVGTESITISGVKDYPIIDNATGLFVYPKNSNVLRPAAFQNFSITASENKLKMWAFYVVLFTKIGNYPDYFYSAFETYEASQYAIILQFNYDY